jgi:hypothetical protein
MRKFLVRIFKYSLIIVIAGFLIIQLVPYGHNHTNPPVVEEPGWDTLQTQALTERACFACHSNETVWPWYSNIAPVSWLVQRDVQEGRHALNFSQWGRSREREEGEEVTESITEGKMPPSFFLLTHPEARLTVAEKAALVQGLQATLGGETGLNENGRELTEHAFDDD